jgi:hypothetical protein
MCLNCSVVVVLWHKSEIKLIRRSKGCLIVQWDRERSIECQQCGDHGSQNYKSVGFQTVKKLSKPCAVVTSFGLKKMISFQNPAGLERFSSVHTGMD